MFFFYFNLTENIEEAKFPEKINVKQAEQMVEETQCHNQMIKAEIKDVY